MPTAGLILLVAATEGAWAAPRFDAEHERDAGIALAAWGAGLECTGWEGHAHPSVQMVRRKIPGDYLGLAYHDDEGLYRIDLDPTAHRIEEVIVHEVAHAWVSSGPPALAEGRTELLADCIVRRRPGLAPLQWDDGRDVNAMPSLLTWSNRNDHGPAMLADVRTDAYLGAARLMRTASLLVPEYALWPEEGMDWAGFEALLEQAGPRGELVHKTLHASAEAQRAALSDQDLDGVPRLAEAVLGSDPARWDTDGDGWWDGALLSSPEGAVPLPLDGTPVCTGRAAPPEGSAVVLVTGGNLRGTSVPDPLVRPSSRGPDWVPVPWEARHSVGRGMVPPNASILVQADGPTHRISGGLWASVDGVGLHADAACISTVDLTVYAADRRFAPLVPAFAADLAAARALAADRWGPEPGRVAVALGAKTSLSAGAVVFLSDRDIDDAVAHGTLDDLARLAVAVDRTWDSGERSWRAAQALARALQLEAAPGPEAD